MNRLSTRGSATAMLLVLAAGAVGALVACADSDEVAPLVDSNETDSGGISTLPEASAPVDAGAEEADADADAAKDAETDAPARICSDDNFCHSVLPPGTHALRGVWGDGQGIVWAVSNGGSVLRWDGSAWAEHTTGLKALATIWGSGPTDLWLLATDGTVYRGTGASSSSIAFAPVTLPGDATVPIKCLWGSGPDDIWAVGGAPGRRFDPPKGRVLHYTGESGGWAVDEELSARPMGYENVWGSPTSGLWMEGTLAPDNFGQIVAQVLRRAPGTTTWTQFDLPPDPQVSSGGYAKTISKVSVLPSDTIWLVGSTSSRFGPRAQWRGDTADNGQTFTWSFRALDLWEPQVNAVWGSPSNEVWGVGQPGRIARWNGTKWIQAAIRVTNTPVTTPFHGIWGTSSTDFWVVGDNAALHKTTGTKP